VPSANLAPLTSDKRSVLLVDDNATNQLLGRLQLEKLGCRVDVVGNGAEALSALGAAPYDLVLMDWQMPVMDGLEATRRMRLAEGALRTLPVIAMTANALEGDRQACVAAGMNDYLSKPLRLESLRDALERWLPRS
jgi:CheY-like chemotaxis protein